MSGYLHQGSPEEEFEEATTALLSARRAADVARLHAFAGAHNTVVTPSTVVQLAALQQAQYERRVATQMAHHEQHQAQALRLRQQVLEAKAGEQPRVIPIGFFRDPRGNSWAASLQHPSTMTLTETAPENPVKRPQNANDRIITLSSDDEETDVNDSNTAHKPGMSPKIKPSVPIQPVVKRQLTPTFGERIPSETVAKKLKTFESQGPKMAKEATNKPKYATTFVASTASKVKTIGTRGVIGENDSTPTLNLNATTNLKVDSTKVEQPSTLSSTYPVKKLPKKPMKALAGLFTQKLLSTQQSETDRHNGVKEFVNKLLLTATGWTKETAPTRIPFPPQQLTIDMDQVEELAHDLVADRFQAVGGAMRVSYSEMKSRHDEILLDWQGQLNKQSSKHEDIQALNKQHQANIQTLEEAHKTNLSVTTNKVEYLKREVASLKARLVVEQQNQQRSLKAFMKASVYSMRLLKKS